MKTEKKEAPKKEEPTTKPSQPAPKKETSSQAVKSGDRVFASPLAKKLAREKNIDLSVKFLFVISIEE